jgi:hypothetical protein
MYVYNNSLCNCDCNCLLDICQIITEMSCFSMAHVDADFKTLHDYISIIRLFINLSYVSQIKIINNY